MVEHQLYNHARITRFFNQRLRRYEFHLASQICDLARKERVEVALEGEFKTAHTRCIGRSQRQCQVTKYKLLAVLRRRDRIKESDQTDKNAIMMFGRLKNYNSIKGLRVACMRLLLRVCILARSDFKRKQDMMNKFHILRHFLKLLRWRNGDLTGLYKGVCTRGPLDKTVICILQSEICPQAVKQLTLCSLALVNKALVAF